MFKTLEKIAPSTFVLPKRHEMRVPGLIIASEKLLEAEMEKPLQQVCNVATLPGIVGYSIAMPDIHWGYGFPIGGVAAMDCDEGVISPGGVGYDINCGVRLAVAPFQYDDLSPKILETLLKEIFHHVPSGVGHGHRRAELSQSDYHQLLEIGARWSIEQGHGTEGDLAHIESHGCLKEADASAVSHLAKERGKKQLGSIGSGNHFIEIGKIQDVFSSEIASEWGIQKGQIYILIHSGSRGFGHQVCQDTLSSFLKQGFAKGLHDPQLIAAPIKSEAGQRYFAAMAAAANYAFNNRQQIMHTIRKTFHTLLGCDFDAFRLIYDVCHNIAKFETHMVEGKPKRLFVHRKGATRAYGPGSQELTPLYQKTGQPVLVPGDMGRSSHLMVGLGNPLTWCSSCHGAGRALSRIQSKRNWADQDPFAYMKMQGIQVMASSMRTVVEEMPNAYKNVHDVVEAVEEAQLASRVVSLKPRLVIKG